MPYKDRKDVGGAGGAPPGNKPFVNPSGDPPPPSTPPPPGYEYQLQTDPRTGTKFWGVVAAAAIGAIGSYLSARQANKPRSGYTDQTTTQTPYMEDTLRPDIEAILNFQRQLINEGPHYVGNPRFWPTSASPQPGTAPPPMERTDQRNARTRAEFDAWRAGGGTFNRDTPPVDQAGHDAVVGDPKGLLPQWAGGIDKAGDGAPGGGMATPRERTFGGWTAAELESDPSRVGELGDRGAAKYDRYRQRHPLEDMSETSMLPLLRSIFSARRG